MKKKGRIGSSFDDFLKEEAIYEEVTARAMKRVIARQFDAFIEEDRDAVVLPLKTDKTPPGSPP